MPGFLDPSGGLGGGMLDPSDMFDTPEYRRMRMFDTLGNLGAALIQAGAPSRMPSSPFAAIGAALTSDNGSEDRYLKRLLTSSQLQKTRQELANDKAWRDMFSAGGGSAPTDAASWKSSQPAASAPAVAGGGGSPDQAAFVQMMMPHAMEISKQTGLDPKLVIAQSALETGWGTSAPGNNYFGVKSHGRPGGQMLATTEAGPGGGLVPTQDSFRTYADPGAAAQDYIEFIKGNAGRYLPVRMARGLDAQIDAMGKSGYATDPQYGAKLRQIAMNLPAGGPQVAQGDASGNSVQPAQYSPPQAFRPQTMQDVIQTMPEGVRKMVGVMGRKEGLPVLMKYADPGSEAVWDTQTNQVVFIPKTMVGQDPRYAPVKGAELDLQRQQLANSQRKTDIDERNAKVTIGNDGRPVVNQAVVDAETASKKAGLAIDYTPVVDTATGQTIYVPKSQLNDPRYRPVEGDRLALDKLRTESDVINRDVLPGGAVNQPLVETKKAISAAQGTDPEGKIREKLAEDVIKRNSDWQKAGVQGQNTIYNLNTFEKLADQVKQGRFQGTMTDMKAALKGAGIDLNAWGIPDNVGPAQAMQMMSQRAALEMRQDMPGPMSDGDRQFMERGSVSIERDPNANKIMVEYLRGNAERAKDRAKFASEYMRSKAFTNDPGGIDDYVNGKMAGKNYFNPDVLPQQSMAPPGAIPGAPAQPGAPVDLYDKYGLKRK